MSGLKIGSVLQIDGVVDALKVARNCFETSYSRLGVRFRSMGGFIHFESILL